MTESGCSPSEAEGLLAKEIAETDPIIRDILDSYDDETQFPRVRVVLPRYPGGEQGHRYVGVRWNLDGHTEVIEVIVDMTTEQVCHDC